MSSSNPLHHLALVATDLNASGAFYDIVLGCCGYTRHLSRENILTWAGPGTEILLYRAKGRGLSEVHSLYNPGFHHAAFRAANREVVDGVEAQVSELGGCILETAMSYPQYSATYYATYLRDPDGLKIEVMCD